MKKVLLSSVAALAVFAAAAPAFAEQDLDTAKTAVVTVSGKEYKVYYNKAGEEIGRSEIIKDNSTATATQPETSTGDNLDRDGHIKRVVPNGTHARINVKDRLNAPVAGVTVDFLVNGVASQAVTDANGDASIAAPAGTVVRYRVAAAPKGYFQNPNQEGSIVVGGDMFTNAYLVIEKTDSYLNPNYTPGSDNKPGTANGSKEEAKSEAKSEAQKTENKGGEAAKAGKASSAQAGKALPKTSAVK